MILMFSLLAALLALPVCYAQESEPPEFDVRRELPRRLHPSETDRFREVPLRSWGVAWNVYYTMRSYNISDIRGLDNSLATTWLNSFDFAGLGVRTHIEYRASTEWRFSILPRVDAAYGILNNSYHNTFELEGLPFTHNYPSANDVQKLSINAELEIAARWRWLWFTAKFNTWAVFRRRDIRGHETVHRDPQLGVLAEVKDRKRTEWEQAYLFGGATGVGFEFFFLEPQSRFILFLLLRPFNNVEFRGGTGVTHGFEIMLRSADFDISNVVGLFFEVGIQAYLPTSYFNDIYYTQFSLGVKFR